MQPGGPPSPIETRNLILAFVLIFAIMFGWDYFIGRPQRERVAAERAQIEAQAEEKAVAPGEAPPPLLADREETLTQSAAMRVPIAPATGANGAVEGELDGSILLTGARFDDLNLRDYRESLEPGSPEVTLLSPHGAEHGFDAFMGWQDRNPRYFGVGEDDVWNAPEGARLTPERPLELTFDSGDGLQVKRTITLDRDFMFTVTDELTNAGAEAREVRPFGVVRRQGLPEHHRKIGVVHQGMIGAFGPKLTLQMSSYEKAQKHAREKSSGEAGENERILELQGEGGWLGITDHYWLAAITVPNNERMGAFFDSRPTEQYTDFRAAYTGDWRSIGPGESVSYTQHLFAGAKRVELLRAYEKQLDIPKFDDAVDWGIFWFLTRPLFALLDFFGGMVGNFGIAILLSTIVIRTLTFPLVYQSFKMAAKMRAVAPKMKEIQERFAADKQRQQQEILKLYQAEKVNPVAGCAPMFLQIPVFWSLYKTLTVTIEMRHAPFFGWIHDLSAPDPTTVFNLFGLLPYDPTALPILGGLLAIGVWPLLNGLSMWGTQALSPPPTDPIQAQIFRFLPILFTFMFASFAAGLVIYYTFSNVITTMQQYIIMRRQGVETQLDQFIKKRFGSKKNEIAAPAE